MKMEPIVVEQIYKAEIGLVWKAITEKSQMRQWFFEPIPDFEPEAGFETEFDIQVEGENYRHQWKVTEVVPEKRIVYEWRYGGYPGNSSVTWELLETGVGTKLMLTHKGFETFPQDNSIFSRESGETGWSYFLHERLKAYLER